jgi:excisionase family DNA binding protein
MQPQTFPEIMTIEQVALYLQLHPQVVYRHVRAGTLPVSRIGRTIRFKKSVLDTFLESGAWAAAGRFIAFAQTVHSQGTPVAVPAPATNAPMPMRKPQRFMADID